MDEDIFQELFLLNQVGGLLQRNAVIEQGEAANRKLEEQNKVLRRAASAHEELVRRRDAESARIQSLPKCPVCLLAAEVEAKRCPQCREALFWLPSESLRDLQVVGRNDLSYVLMQREDQIHRDYVAACEKISEALDAMSTFRVEAQKIKNLNEVRRTFKEANSLNSTIKLQRVQLGVAERTLRSLTQRPAFRKQDLSQYFGPALFLLAGAGLIRLSYFFNAETELPLVAAILAAATVIFILGGLSLVFTVGDLIPRTSRAKRREKRTLQNEIDALRGHIAENDSKLSRMRTPSVVKLEGLYSELSKNTFHAFKVDIDHLASAYSRVASIAEENGVSLEQRTFKPPKSPFDFWGMIMEHDPFESDLDEFRLRLNMPLKQSALNIENAELWIKRGKRTLGPITRAQLTQLLNEEGVAPSDEIAGSLAGPWLSARDAIKHIGTKN